MEPGTQIVRDLDANESNKAKPRRKSFFTTTLNLALESGFLPRGFLLASSYPISDSQILSSLPPPSTKMRFHTIQFFAGVLAMITVVNAHIEMVYPALRGPNVSKNQTLFCGQCTLVVNSLVLVSSSINFPRWIQQRRNTRTIPSGQ